MEITTRLFASGLCVLLTTATSAQVDDRAGSTVQGDILRGEGQYLRGAAWYELNAAKAASINTDTAMKIDAWNRQVYDAYMQERAAHLQRRANLTKAQADAAQKRYEEREVRLRTAPTSDDVIKGDALNALLLDLSNPSIASSSWRAAKVSLPDDLSIPGLVFRFAPKPGSKDPQALGRGVIALARLDTIKGSRWGTVLSIDSLAPERKAYEAAFIRVRDECLAGKLSLDSPLQLKKTLLSLKDRLNKVVPTENGYRAAAARAVDELIEAAKIFHADTIDYAREMIADTQQHDAKTVGELLAFMRKYRLLFATAEKSPSGGEMYGRLYGLLKEQKAVLQIGETANIRQRLTKDQEAVLRRISVCRKTLEAFNFPNKQDTQRIALNRSAIEELDRAEKASRGGEPIRIHLANAGDALKSLLAMIRTPSTQEKIKATIKSLEEMQEETR
jgi:hypothetical protein